MDYATYEVEAQVEEYHWWFLGRRKLFRNIIDGFRLSPGAKILDIGTSTGTNLRMLRDAGYVNVLGLDMHDEAIRWCSDKGLGIVEKGDICNIPYINDSYDLVLATDIIEHVDEDELALREISRILKPGGRALLTVPAFRSLWGLQDEVSQHKRRYRQAELIEKINKSGLFVEECFYFNYLLFVPIWLIRQIIWLFHIDLKSENQLNSSAINYVLKYIFMFDVTTARKLRLPFGVSLLATVSKTKTVSFSKGPSNE